MDAIKIGVAMNHSRGLFSECHIETVDAMKYKVRIAIKTILRVLYLLVWNVVVLIVVLLRVNRYITTAKINESANPEPFALYIPKDNSKPRIPDSRVTNSINVPVWYERFFMDVAL